MGIHQKPGGKWQIDVTVKPSDNPSGKSLRARKTVESRAIAIREEIKLAAYLMEHGEAPPEASNGEAGTLASRTGGRSLEAAIHLAWVHPSKGWALNRTGEASRRDALECAEIIGKDKPCATITTTSFDKIMDALLKRGNSGTTIRTKCQNFSRALWFAERKGWIDARPNWEPPRKGKNREWTFSPLDEEKALGFFRVIDQFTDMHDLMIVALDLGMRQGELLMMQPEWIDFDKRFITVPGEFRKAGKTAVVVCWSDRALEALQRAVYKQKERFVSSGERRLFAVSKRGICERFERLRVHLGQPGNKEIVFHATRHTAISRMLAKNVPISFVMDQVDHKHFATTKRYTHLQPQDRLAALQGVMAK